MKKIFFILSLTAFAHILPAQEVNISSKSSKGEFITTANIHFYARNKAIEFTINKFVMQYQNNLKALFGWALKDLKLEGEQDNFIMFNLKSHTYNQSTNEVNGVMDINVTFLNRDNKDVKYVTKLNIRENTPQNIIIEYEMPECDKVIDHVSGTIKITQENDISAVCDFTVSVKLRTPYNLMSMKQYEENLEWRFSKFLENLKREVEQMKVND